MSGFKFSSSQIEYLENLKKSSLNKIENYEKTIERTKELMEREKVRCKEFDRKIKFAKERGV